MTASQPSIGQWKSERRFLNERVCGQVTEQCPQGQSRSLATEVTGSSSQTRHNVPVKVWPQEVKLYDNSLKFCYPRSPTIIDKDLFNAQEKRYVILSFSLLGPVDFLGFIEFLDNGKNVDQGLKKTRHIEFRLDGIPQLESSDRSLELDLVLNQIQQHQIKKKSTDCSSVVPCNKFFSFILIEPGYVVID